MTDKPKPPETPGMAEVSAKFVDELRSRDPVLDQIDRIEEAARLTDAMPFDEQRDLARDRVIEHEVHEPALRIPQCVMLASPPATPRSSRADALD